VPIPTLPSWVILIFSSVLVECSELLSKKAKSLLPELRLTRTSLPVAFPADPVLRNITEVKSFVVLLFLN